MDLLDTAPFVVNADDGPMPSERHQGRAGMTRSGWAANGKVGYLGLGLMGPPMAGRLLNAGHDVTVWNRPAEKTATLVKAGANPQGAHATPQPQPPLSSCA
jgi:hypothetical protein